MMIVYYDVELQIEMAGSFQKVNLFCKDTWPESTLAEVPSVPINTLQ